MRSDLSNKPSKYLIIIDWKRKAESTAPVDIAIYGKREYILTIHM